MLAIYLAVIPRLVRVPDATWRTAARQGWLLMLLHPLAVVVNVVLFAGLAAALAWLPTLIPFVSAATVALVALYSADAVLAADGHPLLARRVAGLMSEQMR